MISDETRIDNMPWAKLKHHIMLNDEVTIGSIRWSMLKEMAMKKGYK